jgi:hypothetical protein
MLLPWCVLQVTYRQAMQVKKLTAKGKGKSQTMVFMAETSNYLIHLGNSK